eukprot:tig00021098_g18201.t1
MSAAGTPAKAKSEDGGGPLEQSVEEEQALVVLSVGVNEDGQLGLEDKRDRRSPAEVPALAEKCCTGVACGAAHSAAFTVGGALFCWGWSKYGQLGTAGDSQLAPVPVPAMSKHRVVQVAAGAGHTVCLTDAGEVFAFGGNVCGQLGVGSTEGTAAPVHVAALSGARVAEIRCGVGHSVARTAAGEVFTWGKGNFGQLGHGSNQDQSTPARVAKLAGKRATGVATGGCHTVVLTDEGEVYTWGLGGCGQLGHGSTKDDWLPGLVKGLQGTRAVRVACGEEFTVAVSEAGELFTWGWGGCGQLGHGDTKSQRSPKRVEGLAGDKALPVRAIACGVGHTCVLTTGGEVWLWGWLFGWDSFVAEGKQDPETLRPKRLALGERRATAVASGRTHVLVVAEDGERLRQLRRRREEEEVASRLADELRRKGGGPRILRLRGGAHGAGGGGAGAAVSPWAEGRGRAEAEAQAEAERKRKEEEEEAAARRREEEEARPARPSPAGAPEEERRQQEEEAERKRREEEERLAEQKRREEEEEAARARKQKAEEDAAERERKRKQEEEERRRKEEEEERKRKEEEERKRLEEERKRKAEEEKKKREEERKKKLEEEKAKQAPPKSGSIRIAPAEPRRQENMRRIGGGFILTAGSSTPPGTAPAKAAPLAPPPAAAKAGPLSPPASSTPAALAAAVAAAADRAAAVGRRPSLQGQDLSAPAPGPRRPSLGPPPASPSPHRPHRSRASPAPPRPPRPRRPLPARRLAALPPRGPRAPPRRQPFSPGGLARPVSPRPASAAVVHAPVPVSAPAPPRPRPAPAPAARPGSPK